MSLAARALHHRVAAVPLPVPGRIVSAYYLERVVLPRFARIVSTTITMAVQTFSTAWASRLMLILKNGLYRTATIPKTHGQTGREWAADWKAIQTA